MADRHIESHHDNSGSVPVEPVTGLDSQQPPTPQDVDVTMRQEDSPSTQVRLLRSLFILFLKSFSILIVAPGY